MLVRTSTSYLALTSLGQAAGNREDLGKSCPLNILCFILLGLSVLSVPASRPHPSP